MPITPSSFLRNTIFCPPSNNIMLVFSSSLHCEPSPLFCSSSILPFESIDLFFWG
ncbi:hypothetical protein RchiOBHm_Chr1g0363781 [Rosa chinensis]|uniref:Uncharacterized protein n=1 Tax=Rosa chinensis TaxID=74649 RepID=A0A2P6SJK1_ROSCH|nr:hypothetical protein RchiOBHm_Chr1g0363781 [Rosa chinensis]